MAGETWLDPQGVRRLLDNVDAIGADIRAALARLYTLRTGLAAPWGDDEYGTKFAGKNEPTAEATLDNTKEMIDFIVLLCSEGRGAVQGFENLDHNNGQGLS